MQAGPQRKRKKKKERNDCNSIGSKKTQDLILQVDKDIVCILGRMDLVSNIIEPFLKLKLLFKN